MFVLPALLLLLLDRAPLSRAFSITCTPRTYLAKRRLLREKHFHGAADPIIGIGSWTLTPQLTTREGTWRSTALFDNPDPNENTNENNQTGNAGNENENNKRSKSKTNPITKIESANSRSLFKLNSDFDLDPTLLVPDLLGVAVACELLGLLDAVNEPSFLQNGGWLQSAGGGVPTSLPLLVSRFSTDSVFWIASCFGVSTIINGNGNGNGKNSNMTSNDSKSKSNTKDTGNAMATGQSAVGNALRIGAVFCILRIVLTLAVAVAVATAGATGWDSSTTATVDALLGVLRECYVVVLVTAATRYVVQALYY